MAGSATSSGNGSTAVAGEGSVTVNPDGSVTGTHNPSVSKDGKMVKPPAAGVKPGIEPRATRAVPQREQTQAERAEGICLSAAHETTPSRGKISLDAKPDQKILGTCSAMPPSQVVELLDQCAAEWRRENPQNTLYRMDHEFSGCVRGKLSKPQAIFGR